MRSQLRGLLLACAVVIGVVVAVPQSANAQKVVLCSGVTHDEVAACDTSDWANHMGNSYWSMYAGHNCTNYVAYREAMNGVPTPTVRLHNADQWAKNAQKIGYTVNSTPAKGSAGVYSGLNHVVYIEGVGNGYLLISEDNYPGYWPQGMYRKLKVYPGDAWYPTSFIHFEKAATRSSTVVTPIKEGDFVSYAKSAYRIVGGAPVFVSNWAAFGGVKATKAITATQWNALNLRPIDGTFLRTTSGEVYRVVGGAPVYVSTWSAVGGKPRNSLLTVDQAAVDKAGGTGAWSHLATTPADGTFIRTNGGTVYRIAGGAPMYVGSWDAVGGEPSKGAFTVDSAAIANAGGAGHWAHLKALPADGSYIESGATGAVYRIAGGAPMFVSSWARMGGQAATVVIDDATIASAGGTGRYGHLTQLPADGTFVKAQPTGAVYVIAGGAPVTVTRWSNVGGEKRTVSVDRAVIDNAGSAKAAYSHLRAMVSNVFLKGGRSRRIVRVNDQSYAWQITSWAAYGGQQPTITVDDRAIDTCDRLDCSPFGALEEADPARARVTLTGWAQDPNTAEPISVRVLVDGKAAATVTASAARADIDDLYHRGSQFGYVVTAPATAGTHQVCAVAVNTGAGKDTELGCQEVEVLPRLTPTFTVTGTASPHYRGRAYLTAKASAQDIPKADGYVTVRWGDKVLAKNVKLVGGVAKITVTGLKKGKRTLTVSYSGTADIDAAVKVYRIAVK